MATGVKATKFVSEPVRLSFVNVWEPRQNDDGKDTYGVVLMIKKDDKKCISIINRAYKEAQADAMQKFNGKLPHGFKAAIRDGDKEYDLEKYPEYAGHFIIGANAYTKPGVLDENGNKMIDHDELYSGCYARVSCNFYVYGDKPGSKSKGIACGLNNIMKTGDGEPFGGRSNAESDFAEFIQPGGGFGAGGDDDDPTW